MSTLRSELQHGQIHLNAVRAHLHRASQLAESPIYDPRWQDAIAVAMTSNHEAWLHINNIVVNLPYPGCEPAPVHHKSADPGRP